MRRLAAIMFTDMVGYSALTQKNEALALDLLEEHRNILRPYFGKHEGREIETAGDAFFVEFNSAVEAANCAIEIQEALYRRNVTEAPERHIRLRIGLHIGDVVYLGPHVHGDGVNIAARLEPLAQPGGICISEDVARQIRNKIRFPVNKLGEEKLKNIAMPMDIYCIALPWLKPEGIREKMHLPAAPLRYYGLGVLALVLAVGLFFYIKKAQTREATFPRSRLAVLPLDNIGQETKDEYFADGMTEELISSLSKIRDLNIIARTSVMKYKDSDDGIAEIGKALMVGTILEGSVRKFENKVRVTVQLIDVNSQEHLWSMEYDRELHDIFVIQSEIARHVAHELQVRLVASEEAQLQKAPTTDMAAYEEYLIGKHYLNRKTPESIQQAIVHFENAIARDPQYALPYASVAYAYTLTGAAGYGTIPREVAARKARAAVMQALALDETLAEAHAALGYIKFRIDWDWQGAEKEFRRAIALKPGYATAHEWYALFLAIHERLKEAQAEMQQAYLLDPLAPGVNTGLARIYHFQQDYDRALAQINKTIALDTAYADAHFTKGMIYVKMKAFGPAIAALQQAATMSNRRPVILGTLGVAYAQSGNPAAARELLAELQAPPRNNDKLYATGMIKNSLGQHQEALAILEKLVEEKYGILIYMKVERNMIGDSDPARYKRLLKKMNLE